VHDRALAEDLAQDGFLRVYQRLSTYDPERKFSSWFFQVLRNVTIDYLRVNRPADGVARHAAGRRTSGRGCRSRECVSRGAGRAGELASAIAAALSHIRPDYREVVVLRYQEGSRSRRSQKFLDSRREQSKLTCTGPGKNWRKSCRRRVGPAPQSRPLARPSETVSAEVP
jgi:RNA polymerase sigma-70 factor (ECF subfamily)